MRMRTSIIAAIVLSLAAAAHAQILTGSIIGTVKDESGSVLPGVTVTLASTVVVTGPASVVTNERGEYRFAQLDPGSYGVTVTLSGFSTYREEGLVVGVGATVERNVSLKVGSLAETITVSGETPMVD